MKHFDFVSGMLLPFSFRAIALVAALLFAFGTLCFAQTLPVQGQILDESGDPLPAVHIGIYGQEARVRSDETGHYALTVERGALLEFSLKDHETQRIVVWDSPEIDVQLQQVRIDEMLETGYVSMPRRDITGSIVVVQKDIWQRQPVQELSQQLIGQAAGLAGSGGGEPGMGAGIRIRGPQSFRYTEPLYVVDGMPLPDADLSYLNPQDVSQVLVLKDASAAAIYGSRAANGVVLITTKAGSGDAFRIRYEGYAGVQQPARGWRDQLVQDPLEYGQLLWDRYENGGQTPPAHIFGSGPTPTLPEYLYPANFNTTPDESTYDYPNHILVKPSATGTNWWDAVFQPAAITAHHLSLSGGVEPARYAISAAYFNQQGTMKHTGFERYTVRANTRLTSGKVTLGEHLLLARTTGVYQPIPAAGGQSVMNQALRMAPVVPVYDIGGNFAGTLAGGLQSVSNPLAALSRNQDNRHSAFHVLGDVFAEFQFNEHLTAKTTLGLQMTNGQALRFTYPNYEDLEPSTTYGFAENWHNHLATIWTNTLSYHKQFKKYTLNLLAGHESQQYTARTIGGSMDGYLSTHPNAWYLSPGLADANSLRAQSSGDKSRMHSLFGRFDYAYKEKYLLTASIREDASSRFGPGIKGLFYGVSAGWRLSEERFMNDLTWIEELKVRVGYGLAGNQQIPQGNAYGQFGGGMGTSYYDISGSNTSLVQGFSVIHQANRDTRWEQSQTQHAGVDLSLYGGKVSATFDYFENESSGLLFQAPLPGTAGIAVAPLANTGALKNKGFDLQLAYRGKLGSDWHLQAQLNLSRVQNEITRLDGSTEAVFGTGFESLIGPIQINQVGYPLSSFYGYVADGIFQSNAEVTAHAEQPGAAPGRLRFKDLNRDGTVDALDQGPIGDPYPDLQGGINLSLRFRNVDCSLILVGSVGNEIFNYNKLFSEFGYQNANFSRELLTESWSPDNPYGRIPRLDVSDTYSQQASSYYLEDASFLRISNLQVGYTLPRLLVERLGLSTVRIYAQAHNLATLTGYQGPDPAATRSPLVSPSQQNNWAGYDFGSYPQASMYLAGLTLSF